MLYNDFRPTRFAQVLGQDNVTPILRKQSQYDSYGHSYLFAGASGSGKTTTARIVAMALNCRQKADDGEPCGQCQDCRQIQRQSHWDVFELDAGSQRGIDDIRELRLKAYYSPLGKYKVYLIDECHALTDIAWQAMLKLLEDTPKHLVIILCTTRLEAIPDTVKSRCQLFQFRKLPPAIIARKLAQIAKAVNVPISPEHLTFMAGMSDGNMRQAETVLEQAMTVRA